MNFVVWLVIKSVIQVGFFLDLCDYLEEIGCIVGGIYRTSTSGATTGSSGKVRSAASTDV